MVLQNKHTRGRQDTGTIVSTLALAHWVSLSLSPYLSILDFIEPYKEEAKGVTSKHLPALHVVFFSFLGAAIVRCCSTMRP